MTIWAVFANGRLNSLWAEHDKAEAHAFEVARINGPGVVMVIERVEVRS